MSLFSPSLSHRIFNVIIGILFLATGLILGSHLVMKSTEKENMLQESLSRLNRLEKEVKDVGDIAMKNNDEIAKIKDTVSTHIVDIETFMKSNNRKHK